MDARLLYRISIGICRLVNTETDCERNYSCIDAHSYTAGESQKKEKPAPRRKVPVKNVLNIYSK